MIKVKKNYNYLLNICNVYDNIRCNNDFVIFIISFNVSIFVIAIF